MNISTKVKIQNYKYTVSTFVLLKLVTTVFYQILIFSPNDSPSKTIKNVFISHFPDSKGQMEVE